MHQPAEMDLGITEGSYGSLLLVAPFIKVDRVLFIDLSRV